VAETQITIYIFFLLFEKMYFIRLFTVTHFGSGKTDTLHIRQYRHITHHFLVNIIFRQQKKRLLFGKIYYRKNFIS